MNIYRITTQPGAQIQSFTSAYERRGAATRGWSVTRYYDSGEILCGPEDLAVTSDPLTVDARVEHTLGQPTRSEFSFDDTFTAHERAELQSRDDIPSRFQIEEDYIRIQGPKLIRVITA